MQPQQPFEGQAMENISQSVEKKSHTSAICMACLGILALAGVGFGVYGFMKKPETKVETKVETVVSKEAATNILKPYMRWSPISIMDGLSAGNKILYASSLANGLFDLEGERYYYRELDSAYFNLFGEHLEKTNVQVDGGVTFSYNSELDTFLMVGAAWGAPNPAYERVWSIKEVSLDNNKLATTFYYDSVPVCELINTDMGAAGASEDYCISSQKLSTAGMNEFAESHEGMPTYTFTFGIEDDRYVLVDTKANEVDDTVE